MYKRILFISLFSALLFGFKADVGAPPAVEEYVKFQIKNAGINIDGFFAEFTSLVSYDPSSPNSATFSGEIKVSSINTGIEMRDEHLVGEEYFDATNHPNITFKSTRVAKLTNGNLKVAGTLSVKETSKEVELIVEPTISGDKTYFKAKLELDRLDYEVGENSWVLSDDVFCEIMVAVN
ncbi:MAG TPA: hypothetical protein DCX14_09305 [Flavobacteriales bacterium]|nr:hypothetical protein [Flavobacteriales bacterium]